MLWNGTQLLINDLHRTGGVRGQYRLGDAVGLNDNICHQTHVILSVHLVNYIHIIASHIYNLLWLDLPLGAVYILSACLHLLTIWLTTF